jgi:uncharacterized protein
MNNPFLKVMPSWIQVILLVALSFVCLALGSFIATYFTAMAYGVEYDALMGVLLNQESPQGNTIKLLSIIEQIVGFLAPVVVIVYLFRSAPVMRFLKESPGRMLLAGPAYILLSEGWVVIAAQFNEWIIPENSSFASFAKPLEEQATQIYETMIHAGGFGGIALTIFTMTLLPAFCEEVFFRGALQPLIARIAKNVHIGIWGSAILFSLFHFQLYSFLPRVLLGALLGYLVIWSGSLWTSIIAHFVNNLLAVILILSISPTELENTAEMEGTPWFNFALSFALFGIMTYYLNTISVWDKIKYDYLGIERPPRLENDLEV